MLRLLNIELQKLRYNRAAKVISVIYFVLITFIALIASIAQMIGEDEPGLIPEYAVQENHRRLAAYDAGETEGIPYKKAISYVREQINERR